MAFSMAHAVNGVAQALDAAADHEISNDEDIPGVGSKYAIPGAQPDQPGRRLPKLTIRRDGLKGSHTVQAEQQDLDTLTDAIYRAMVSYYKRKVGYIQVCKYLLFITVFLIMIMMQSSPYYEMHSQARVIKAGLFPEFVEDEMGFPGGRVPNILRSWDDVNDFIAGPVVSLFEDPGVGDEVCNEPHEYQLWRGFGSPDCGIYPRENQTELTITLILKPELTAQQEAEICPPQRRSFRLTKETQYESKKNLFTIAVLMEGDDTRETGGSNTWVPRSGEELVVEDLSPEEIYVIGTQINGFVPGTYRIADVKPRLDISTPGCPTFESTTSGEKVQSTGAESTESEAGSDYCAEEGDACGLASDCCPSDYGIALCHDTKFFCYTETQSALGPCSAGGSPCDTDAMCCSSQCSNGFCSSATSGQSSSECYTYFDVGLVPVTTYEAKKGNANPNDWRRPQNRLSIDFCNLTNSTGHDRRRLSYESTCKTAEDCHILYDSSTYACNMGTCLYSEAATCNNNYLVGTSCHSDSECQEYDEWNYACDTEYFCDPASQLCTIGSTATASEEGSNPEDWYITYRTPICNGTKVPNGTFPVRDIGTVWGVRGFGSTGKCTIDNERKVTATASWNICMENPLTKKADVSKCIFNNGKGAALDIIVGGVVDSNKPIVQTRSLHVVDADWLVTVKGAENAAVSVNFTWKSARTGTIKTQESAYCHPNNRSRKYSFAEGMEDTGCAALEIANPSTDATVCSSVTCQSEEKFFRINEYFPKGSKYHYFPDEDSVRERYFKGTANKMVGGVLIRQNRYLGSKCSPKSEIYKKLFASDKSSFPCIAKGAIDKDNSDPFGVDPVYLSSSKMYNNEEWKTRKDVYQDASSYKINGLPFAFTVPVDPEEILQSPLKHGFPVILQNNFRSSHAARIAEMLKEGYFIDELTKNVRITLLNFNPYVSCYTMFQVKFSQSYPAGEVKVTYDHYSFTLDTYTPDFATFVKAVLEIVYYTFVAATIVEEVWELLLARSHGVFYFTDAWNYIEVGCACLQVVNFINWIRLFVLKLHFKPQEQYVVYPLGSYRVGGLIANRDEEELAKMLDMYDQTDAIVAIEREYKNINTIIGFLLMLRLMKQLDFHPRLGVITRTLQQAFSSLMHFLAVFIVLTAIFIQLGIYAFGQNTEEFSDVHGAWYVFYHLLQGDLMILGTLTLSNNSGINKPLAWIYLIMFFIIIFLIMLNVLLAIMIDAYTDARDRASEDALETADSVIVEASSILWHEFKAFCHARQCTCRKRKSEFVTHPMVKVISGPAKSEKDADEENENARIAAELREVVASAMHTGHHKPMDSSGTSINMPFPKWESIYYRLKYERPHKTVMKQSSLLRTARGDLTQDELIAVIHHQLQRYNIDTDPDTELSKRVAKTILWRYGKSIDIKQRRELGPEHRNIMNEHRFNRLEEQLAVIAESGSSRWQGIDKIVNHIQVVTANAVPDSRATLTTNNAGEGANVPSVIAK